MIRNGNGEDITVHNSEGDRTGAAANDGVEEECILVYECSLVLTLKFVVLALFLLPLAEYSIRTRYYNKNSTEIDQIQNATIESITDNTPEVKDTLGASDDGTLTENLEHKKPTEVVRIKQNKCSRNSMLDVLEEILRELFEKNEFCTPDDFYNVNKHKIPKNAVRHFRNSKLKTEAKVPAIVNYAVGIVLMVSLGAALVELYKAKRQPAKKNGKNSLSRKCSLADLTVMKHHRKEMVRRESLMEVPEELLYSKQLGNRPTPLHRQCSFPVGPSSLPPMGTTTSSFSSRRFSIQPTARFVPVLDGRPATVLAGRRHSIVSDGRQPLIMIESDRRISVDSRGMIIDRIDDAADRRYHGHGRRVHRH